MNVGLRLQSDIPGVEAKMFIAVIDILISGIAPVHSRAGSVLGSIHLPVDWLLLQVPGYSYKHTSLAIECYFRGQVVVHVVRCIGQWSLPYVLGQS